VLAPRVRWRRAADGVEWGELALAGSGEARRTRLVVARIDPRRVRLSLDTAFGEGGRGAAWTVGRAPRDAILAVNAGQFGSTMPWGWVVLDGRQLLAPGSGPLATAVVVDSAGTVHWLHGDLGARRPARVAWAFQSYPTLLREGEVPEPLRAEGAGLDLAHRDARAAIGRTADGRLLVAITRFDLLGGRLAFVPLGLTTPEMAAVMGALGARDAVMLDGGISAQLLVREAGGRARTWEGVRAVPLALVAGRR
jgi:exopolysaccharide biosynthesis protein